MYGVNLDITELQVAHDELEVRVVERTQELAKANTMLLQQMEERAYIEEQRIQLLKRLFTVQEDERGRIARDIHDHLGQRLTALRLKIASVRALCGEDTQLAQRVTRLQEISELLDKEVSFLAWELRPDILDKTNFVHALEQYVVEWSRHSDVFAEFSVVGVQDLTLDRDIENNLYRITQEALNNAAKYARATRINVILEKRKENLILIVEDNGIGFDPAAAAADTKRQGFGLVGMRERASLVGGTLEIESVPGEGTTIFVRVPVDQGK
jgi:signal transduction histidine kinase